MSLMDWIFAAALLLYGIQALVIMIGSSRRFAKRSGTELPTVSVIVAARNEEQNILRCIESLDKLDYPEGKIEIIIVDDHSTDQTGSIIDGFIAGRRNFTKVVPEPGKGNLKGKANALANGIAKSSGEIILNTDADCAVSPSWARTIASYYDDETGMVFGYTDQETGTSFNGMQSLDFIYLLSVAAATINIKYPTSCIGNNMSMRRKVYDAVGGFEHVPFSVTEDFSLLMAISRNTDYTLKYPRDPGARVTSRPCESVRGLFHQKKRWAVGGLDSELYGFLIMVTGYTGNALLLAIPFFFGIPALIFGVGKLLLDAGILLTSMKTLGLLKQFRYFPVFQVYFIIYVLLLPFVVLPNKKVVWKERKY